MFKWMTSRLADVLLAFLVIVLLLLAVLTQPVWFWGEQKPLLQVNGLEFELQVRELIQQGLPEQLQGQAQEQGQGEVQTPVATSVPKGLAARQQHLAEYIKKQLPNADRVRLVEHSEYLRSLRFNLGAGGDGAEKPRLVIVSHHVLTDTPAPEVAQTTVSLINMAHLLAEDKLMTYQVEVWVFLHTLEHLQDTLLRASRYHVDQLDIQDFGRSKQKDIVGVITPGLRVPDALYQSEQWGFLDFVKPSLDDDVALFGRIEDVLAVRELKRIFHEAGVESVGSLSIPAGFPALDDSPLQAYWGSGFSTFLMKPNMLNTTTDYSGATRLMSFFYYWMHTPPD